MDVARPILNGLREHQIDIADDRCGVRLILDVLDVHVAALAAELDATAEFSEDGIEARGVGAIVGLDEILDLVDRRDDRLHLFPQ